MAVVPKLGANYPPGVICDSSMGNAVPKSQCLLGIITMFARWSLQKKFSNWNAKNFYWV